MNFLALLVILISVVAIPLAIWYALTRLQIKQAWGALLFAGILALFFVSLWIYDASGSLRKKHYQQIAGFLQTEWKLPPYDDENWAGSLLAMSMFAEGLADYGARYPQKRAEVQELLEKIVVKVSQEDFFPNINKSGNWKNQGFYLSHLNNILGAFAKNDTIGAYTTFQEKVSTYLAGEISRSPYRHLLSFPRGVKYWTSDNAGILYGLSLFDQQMQANLSAGPAKDWEAFVKRELMYGKSDLPCSAFTMTNKCEVMPTGNHLGWTLAYMAKLQPDFAEDIWPQYKHYFKNNFILIWASANYYHPDDEAPAYVSENQRVLERVYPSVVALRAAAHLDARLTYHQLNNRLLLEDMFRSSSINTRNWEQWLEKGIRFSAECHR